MKTINVIGLIFVLIVLGCSSKTKPNTDTEAVQTLKVDNVIEHPEKYSGTIQISGTVLSTDSSKNYFELGCEDACVSLPVYNIGKLPTINKEAIVTGTLIKDNDKFYFKANNFKQK